MLWGTEEIWRYSFLLMKRRLAVPLAAVLAGTMLLAGCDASVMVETVVPEALEPTPQLTQTQQLPSKDPVEQTLEPTVTPRPTQTLAATVPPAPDPASATVETAAAAPAPAALTALEGISAADFAGNGRKSTIRVAHGTAETGTVVLQVNGQEYDTGIQAGSGAALYVADLDSDGSSELIIVTREGQGAQLYLFRFEDQMLRGALFTYTLPAELSQTGAAEARSGVNSLTYSGIDPIVSLGDGSIAVLTFGTGFQRFVFDPANMQVTESGTLPLDILTGGGVPRLPSSEPAADAAVQAQSHGE